MANDESVVDESNPNASSQPLEYEYDGQPRKQPEKLRTNRTRRGGKNHKLNKKVKFSLLGNNTAGIKAKKDSLEALIKTLKLPSCITLQETKLASMDTFKIEGYQVFQKNRNGSGGVLLTAIGPNLNPLLISTKNEEAEILTVQLSINNRNIRVINGYGPQEDDSAQNKLNFWTGLDQEIL